MTWPIPTLPTNWSNGSPQVDAHPAAHNAVADALNEIAARLPVTSTRTFTGSQDSTTGASYVDWFTIPAITIPTGTRKLVLLITLSGYYSTAALIGQFSARLGAGAVSNTQATVGFAGASDRQTTHWSAEFANPTAGAVVPTIAALRLSGTGVLRVDGSCVAHLVGLFT